MSFFAALAVASNDNHPAPVRGPLPQGVLIMIQRQPFLWPLLRIEYVRVQNEVRIGYFIWPRKRPVYISKAPVRFL